MKKPLTIASSGVWRELRGRDDGDELTNYNISLFRTITINPLYHEYILKKKNCLEEKA
jgi:hypothetical protein